MKIALLGSRGIPNEYGGFEQFAEVLSQGLAAKGHEVTVYCSDNHSYKGEKYGEVKLVHCYDPEDKIGSAGQFVYDLKCMLHARKQKYDIIYLLGYTSSSIWQRILRNKAIIVTNMDGLEWKRSKYSVKVQKFLKFAEKWAVKQSDYLVADSLGIKQYLTEEYSVDSTFHPYGCHILKNADENYLSTYRLQPYSYDMLIARFEPENNIRMILEAYSKSDIKRKLVLIGNYQVTSFGKEMFEKYGSNPRLCFLGALYNQKELQNLRYFSNLYFHGHSVGGTNPSLLEAMGDSCLILYHDNVFNKSIVGNDGFAFSNANELTKLIDKTELGDYGDMILANIKKIEEIYNWETIIDNYEKYFLSLC